jgi:hypothetical protein
MCYAMEKSNIAEDATRFQGHAIRITRSFPLGRSDCQFGGNSAEYLGLLAMPA